MCDKQCQTEGGTHHKHGASKNEQKKRQRNSKGAGEREQMQSSPVAKIPWLPQPSEKIDFEKSAFFKFLNGPYCCMSKVIQKLELYRILNETFPCYLPKRYHAMECKELSENCPNGQYWASAGHFLYATHAHDHMFYAIFKSMLTTGPFTIFECEATQPFYHMEFKHTYLRNGSAECKTAAEYLLEPWVLLQLLTQPMIMYQWGIALLTESIKLRIEIIDMVQNKCPATMNKCVQLLHRMANNANDLAYELIQLFYKCSSNNGQNHFVNTRVVLKKLHLMLKLFLPSISFVVSNECRILIKNLKKMARSQPTQSPPITGKNGTPAVTLKDIEGKCPKIRLFTARYWRDLRLVSFFDQTKEICPTLAARLPEGSSFPETCSLKEEMRRKMKAWSDDKDSVLVMNSNAAGLPDSENGVIYNLICLKNDLELAVKNKSISKSDIYGSSEGPFCAPKLDGPDLLLQNLEEALSKAMEPSKEEFIDYVKNKIKSECFSSDWDGLPDYKKMGAEKIAHHFQERIKTMVYKMNLEHNIGLEKTGPYTSYPEVFFIQYLLPCFVASFLDLDKDENATQTQKEHYFQFLHELIKCYENHLYSQDLKEHYLFPFTIVIRNDDLWWQFPALVTDVELFLKSILRGSAIFEPILHFLNFMTKPNEDHDCKDLAARTCKPQQWQKQMLMFMWRIRTAAEKVGWKNDCIVACPLGNVSSTRFTDSKNERDVIMLHGLILYVYSLRIGINIKSKIKLPRGLLLAAKKTTESQLRAISIYLLVANIERNKQCLRSFTDWQGPAFPFDPMYAYWKIIHGEKWLAKIAIMEKIVTEEREDPTLVTLDFAKNNKCYDFVLPRLNEEGKVKMKRSGEVTFVPIKHCRWCGLADVKEFRLCPECKENADYPDVNLFCSEKCEKEALEKQHMEEHARYLMQRCGI